MGKRHEIKHQISYADLLTIRQRMKAVAGSDANAIDGKYLIRSLYFDTPGDKALREKVDGVDNREKFRIRYYNFDTSFIRLEKKSKENGLGEKAMAKLSAEESQRIVNGDTDWMYDSDEKLIRELYSKMKTTGLAPKTIVDYDREPFTFIPGNVRVTLDYNIRTGLRCTDFLNPHVITMPVPDDPIILEVKWDGYLPDIIRMAVGLENRRVGAYSKYAACRMYE
ncbi:MAG: polyphosphate polymerase domain-containing protein [Lachnospiraceae bacterium]|nr:polyphosphate polymerase domain-containing protein [Lachnospiraceae bacterium]